MASGVFADALGCSEFAFQVLRGCARRHTSAQRHARTQHADTGTTLPHAQQDTDAHRLTQTRTQTQTHTDTRKDSNTKHGDSNSNSNSNININIKDNGSNSNSNTKDNGSNSSSTHELTVLIVESGPIASSSVCVAHQALTGERALRRPAPSPQTAVGARRAPEASCRLGRRA